MGVHTFCLDTFIWLVGQFVHVKLTYGLLFAILGQIGS